jgi:hypothetical protein
MLLSAIVLIVIRLFCLSWLVQGIVMFASNRFVSDLGSSDLARWELLPPLLLLVMAVVAWFAAPRLARLISGRHDAVIPIPGLSLEQLYSASFVFLGLDFALGSLGELLNWFYFFLLTHADNPPLGGVQQPPPYEFSRVLITFIAGIVCIIYNQRWARKLNKSAPDTSA